MAQTIDPRIHIMSQEKVNKAIVKLALPSILTSLVSSIYNAIDTFYLGMLNDTVMVASINVALPLILLIHALGSSLGVGAQSYVGRLFGAGKFEEVKKAVQTTMSLAFMSSILFSIIAALFMEPILKTVNQDPLVLSHAVSYALICVSGTLVFVLKQVLSYLLRAEGDVRFAMGATILGIVLNIITVPALMFQWGLGLGIIGVAIGTVAAEGISTALMLHRLCKTARFVHWDFMRFSIDPLAIREIFNVGFAAFVRDALPSLSYGLFANSASLFGVTFLAAVGISRKIYQFVYFALNGFCYGIQPFISYNYGAKNYRRLKQAMRFSLGATMIYSTLMTIVFLASSPMIVRMFLNDVEVIRYGKDMLYGYCASLFAIGYYLCWASYLQSTGKGMYSLILSLFRQAVFYIPLMAYLPRLWGMFGFYATQPISDWLIIAIVIILIRPCRKELNANA